MKYASLLGYLKSISNWHVVLNLVASSPFPPAGRGRRAASLIRAGCALSEAVFMNGSGCDGRQARSQAAHLTLRFL